MSYDKQNQTLSLSLLSSKKGESYVQVETQVHLEYTAVPISKPPKLVLFCLLLCRSGGRARIAPIAPDAIAVLAFPKRIRKVRAWGTTSYQT